MIGAQASQRQLETIPSCPDIGGKEGTEELAGGERARHDEALEAATTCTRPCSGAGA